MGGHFSTQEAKEEHRLLSSVLSIFLSPFLCFMLLLMFVVTWYVVVHIIFVRHIALVVVGGVDAKPSLFMMLLLLLVMCF